MRFPFFKKTAFLRARGEGYSTKIFKGRLLPEVQPLTLLYIIFDRKGTPFVYLPLKNGPPFTYLHTYVPLNVTFEANKTQATEIKRALTKKGIQVVLKNGDGKKK